MERLIDRLSQTAGKIIDVSFALLSTSTYGAIILAALIFLVLFRTAFVTILLVAIPIGILIGSILRKAGYGADITARLSAALVLAVWIQIEWFGIGNTPYWWLDAMLSVIYMIALFFSMTRFKPTRLIVFVVALFAAIGHPLYRMCGYLITIPNAETLLGTNIEECLGLLLSLPRIDQLVGILVLTGVTILIFSTTPPPRQSARQTTMLLSVFSLLATLPVFLNSNSLMPVGHYLFTAKCSQLRTLKSDWIADGRIEGRGTARNYIIVMSESLRPDALGVYGNPFDTSPFLASVPHKLIEHAVAPAGATMYAIPRELALTKDGDDTKVEAHNNVVAFAKSVGLDTYWLSSHTRVTDLSRPLSIIAESADSKFYAKNHDDFALTEEFERILNKDNRGARRFFVINTYGAHEPVCERVEGFGKPFATGLSGKDWRVPFLSSNDFFDCYMSAALKADQVVEKLVRALEKRSETYSLILTSDHGAAFFFKDKELKCCRFPQFKALFDVPFIEIGTDIRETMRADVLRSTTHLARYVPTWLGYTSNKTPHGYDIFSLISDTPMVTGFENKVRRYSEELDSVSFKDLLANGREKNY